MKLLYVASGHPIQEADDCSVWDRLGIEWFSTGAYAISDKPGDLPFIQMKSREKYLDEFLFQDRQMDVTNRPDFSDGRYSYDKIKIWTNQEALNRIVFTPQFLRQFDAVLFNFFIENVNQNREALGNIPHFLKTYGMHPFPSERQIKAARKRGLKVIRNSPKECVMYKKHFSGMDYMIRGSVDENELVGWVGDVPRVCTFTSYLLYTHIPIIQQRKITYTKIQAACAYPCEYYGIGNNFISHEAKLEKLKHYRVNLVTGTPSANNTYSMVEAWMIGQPMVVFGRPIWGSVAYEPDELMTHGEDGFIGNSSDECVYYIEKLMKDDALAQKISINARKKALSIYSRAVACEEWLKMFKNEGLM